MTRVLMKRGNLDTGTWRMSGEDEGKDWDDVSTRQGMPKMASTPPESREKSWNRSFPLSLQEEPTLERHAGFRLAASGTVRQSISEVHQSVYFTGAALGNQHNNSPFFPPTPFVSSFSDSCVDACSTVFPDVVGFLRALFSLNTPRWFPLHIPFPLQDSVFVPDPFLCFRHVCPHTFVDSEAWAFFPYIHGVWILFGLYVFPPII